MPICVSPVLSEPFFLSIYSTVSSIGPDKGRIQKIIFVVVFLLFFLHKNIFWCKNNKSYPKFIALDKTLFSTKKYLYFLISR